MEHFNFNLKSEYSQIQENKYKIEGVVASGNLEVMVESSSSTSDETYFEVKTSVAGYKKIWKAVFNDITSEYKTGGLKFYINDAGAVPAVVSLRLRQAIEAIKN